MTINLAHFKYDSLLWLCFVSSDHNAHGLKNNTDFSTRLGGSIVLCQRLKNAFAAAVKAMTTASAAVGAAFIVA